MIIELGTDLETAKELFQLCEECNEQLAPDATIVKVDPETYMLLPGECYLAVIPGTVFFCGYMIDGHNDERKHYIKPHLNFTAISGTEAIEQINKMLGRD